MMARAGAHGAAQLYQYWGYAWVYAATIANATFAVRDTGKSLRNPIRMVFQLSKN